MSRISELVSRLPLQQIKGGMMQGSTYAEVCGLRGYAEMSRSKIYSFHGWFPNVCWAVKLISSEKITELSVTKQPDVAIQRVKVFEARPEPAAWLQKNLCILERSNKLRLHCFRVHENRNDHMSDGRSDVQSIVVSPSLDSGAAFRNKCSFCACSRASRRDGTEGPPIRLTTH